MYLSFSREKTVEQTIKVKIPKKKVLKAYREHLMDFKTERMVFYGGAGSGKSYFVALKVIVTLLQSKRKALICRKYG